MNKMIFKRGNFSIQTSNNWIVNNVLDVVLTDYYGFKSFSKATVKSDGYDLYVKVKGRKYYLLEFDHE